MKSLGQIGFCNVVCTQTTAAARVGEGSLKENSFHFSVCVQEKWVKIASISKRAMARCFSTFFFGRIATAGRAGQGCQHLACGVVQPYRLHHAPVPGQENGACFRTWAMDLFLAARSRAAPAHACGASRKTFLRLPAHAAPFFVHLSSPALPQPRIRITPLMIVDWCVQARFALLRRHPSRPGQRPR